MALLICENNCATPQSGNHLVEGSHDPGGWKAHLPRIKDGGIEFFHLKQRQRLFEGRSNDAVIPHTAEQDAQVVAHQRIRTKH
jgi:hypothetical protein